MSRGTNTLRMTNSGVVGTHASRSARASNAVCAGHEKLVTALDVDRAGARALTGGEDYQLRMFDFGGMKRDMRAFRKIEPSEGYPVNAVSFSPTGDSLCMLWATIRSVCATGSSVSNLIYVARFHR